MGTPADFVKANMTFVAKVKHNCNEVVKRTLVEVGVRLVDRSPVGDPSLWMSKPAKDYVPGTFRANWQLGSDKEGVPSEILDKPDADGGLTKQRLLEELPDDCLGKKHVYTNNLPYAIPLELGWSSQAPSGVAGLTAIEVPDILEKKAQEVLYER